MRDDAIMNYEDTTIVKTESEQILQQCFKQFRLDEVFLSFNGGKDCTVLLDLTINTLKNIYNNDNVQKDLKVIYMRTNGPFREMESFIEQIEAHYKIKLLVFEGEMKTVLENILENDGRLKACLMGTRKTDPYSQDLNYFQKTDPSWPQMMRVSPILNWSYHQIWTYIRQHRVPYCSLYDRGYTSIGSIYNTSPNPYLEYNLNGHTSYKPAWLLSDASLERAGRKTMNTSHSVQNGHSRLTNGVLAHST